MQVLKVVLVGIDAGWAQKIDRILHQMTSSYQLDEISSIVDFNLSEKSPQPDLVIIYLNQKLDALRSFLISKILKQIYLPVFILTNEYDVNLFMDLVNSGADRVLSIDGLDRNLEGCVRAFFPDLDQISGWGGYRRDENGGNLRIAEDDMGHYQAQPAKTVLGLLKNALGAQDFLASVLNTSAAVVVVLDSHGRIIYLNRRAEMITGYLQSEVVGQNFDRFLLVEEKNEVKKIFNQLQTGEYPITHTNGWLTRQGEVRQITWSNTSLKDADGNLIYVIAMGIDITEEKLREQAFKKSEERFVRIFNSNPAGIGVLRFSDGNFLDVNPSLLRFLGLYREQVIGCSPDKLGLFTNRQSMFDILESVLRRGTTITLERRLHVSGKPDRHLILTLDLVEWDGEMAVLLMVQDNSDRFMAEEKIRRMRDDLEQRVLDRTAALQAANRELEAEIGFRKAMETSSQRLNQIIWETPDLVGIIDLKGRLQYLNKAGREILQINDLESPARVEWASVYPSEERKRYENEVIPAVIKEGIWRGESTVNLPDSRTIPVYQAVLAHRDHENQLQFLSVIANDITEQKQLAEELKKALEQEKEMGTLRSNFFSMTSHQFRTPLSTILSSAELLEHYSRQWDEEKKVGQLHKIEDAAQRMNKMLNDILLIIKVESSYMQLQIRRLDLVQLCGRLVNEARLADQMHHEFEFQSADESCWVLTDEEMVVRVMDNLLSNAVKYSGPQTKIELSLRMEQNLAVLQVVDNGIGILADEEKLIFEPFQRGSNVVDVQGNGLGLNIVDRSLKLIHGKIQIESAVGQGTRIIVQIPSLENYGQDEISEQEQ